MSESKKLVIKAVQAIADEAYDFAEEMLFKALALNTRGRGIYLSLMSVCEQTERWQEALSWASLGLCRLETSQPSSLLVFNERKSFYYLILGDFENALKAANTALKAAEDPNVTNQLNCVTHIVSFTRVSMCKSIALMCLNIDAIENWGEVEGINAIDTTQDKFAYWKSTSSEKMVFEYHFRKHFLALGGIETIPPMLSNSIRWALNCFEYPSYSDIAERLKAVKNRESVQ